MLNYSQSLIRIQDPIEKVNLTLKKSKMFFIIGSDSRLSYHLEDAIVNAEQSAYKSKGKNIKKID